MSGAFSSTAAEAFRTTLDEVLERNSGIHSQSAQGASSSEQNAADLGRRAALLAMADRIWEDHLGPLLDTSEVQELLQVRSRQAVSDLARRRRLLALPAKANQKVYPAFQFDSSGRPYPALRAALEAFSSADIEPHTLASWFCTPQALLEDQTPAAWMKSGQSQSLLVEAASRTAARFSH